MMVRNEADIIRVNILHHLAQGVDHFLVVDNGSSDGTVEILTRLAERLSIQWTRYTGPYYQSEIVTELAREAYLRGADWVIPVDADEFWSAPAGNLTSLLEQSSAEALEVQVVNFIQRRDCVERSTESLLSMTRRTPRAVGPMDRVRRLVQERQFAYVEMMYPPKWISRASPTLAFGVGNHTIMDSSGPTEQTDQVVCLHAPLRCRAVLESLAACGQRATESENPLIWQWLRWQRLAESGELEKEWRANSYERDSLDVGGVDHAMVFDARLRDAAAPWIKDLNVPQASAERVAAALPLKLSVAHRTRHSNPASAAPYRVNQWHGFPEEDEVRVSLRAIMEELLADRGAIVQVGGQSPRSSVLLGGIVKQVCPDATVYVIDVGGLRDEHSVGDEREASVKQVIAEADLTDSCEILSYWHQFPNTAHPISFPSYWNLPISLLFIDSRKDYETISPQFADFAGWVRPGGYLALCDGKDHSPDGEVVALELLGSGQYSEIRRLDRLVILQKL